MRPAAPPTDGGAACCPRSVATPRRRSPSASPPPPPLPAPVDDRPGQGNYWSRAAAPAARRASPAAPAVRRSGASAGGAPGCGAPPGDLRCRSCGGLGRRVRRGLLGLLDHPQLGRGVPEVGLVLAVDQLVDWRRRGLAVEPAVAVVGT